MDKRNRPKILIKIESEIIRLKFFQHLSIKLKHRNNKTPTSASAKKQNKIPEDSSFIFLEMKILKVNENKRKSYKTVTMYE